MITWGWENANTYAEDDDPLGKSSAFPEEK